jgi:hypothetical protein
MIRSVVTLLAYNMSVFEFILNLERFCKITLTSGMQRSKILDVGIQDLVS